jgi:glycosyltransferase involved in cell wall biosynthesis
VTTDGFSFSVIVSTYTRKTFLIDAVKSVLNQKYPADLIEVIVVKSFKDDKIDKQLNDIGVTSIYKDEKSPSKKYLEGLNHCKNELICFLDDDDLYFPEKLKVLSELYSNYPEIDLSVNAYQLVDTKANLIQTSFHVSNREIQKIKTINIFKKENYGERLFLELELNFNSSRFCFRRKIAKQIMTVLSNTDFGIDFAIPYYLMIHNTTFAFTPEYLNMYRIHDDNVSISVSRSQVLEKKYNLDKRDVGVYRTLSQLVFTDNKHLSDFLLFQSSFISLSAAIMGERRKDVIRNLKKTVKQYLRVKKSNTYRGHIDYEKRAIYLNLIIASIFIISPILGRKVRVLF